MTETQAKPVSAATPRRRIISPKRIGIGVAVLLPLLVVVIAVVMRSGLLGPLLLPPIGRALNLDIRADGVVLTPSGELSMRNLVVRHRLIPGEGGEILHAESATAQLDWGRVLAGPSALTSVALDGPHLRVSIDRATRSTNLVGIDLPEAPGGRGPLRLPSVAVNGGSIELGEHGPDEHGNDQGYQRLRSIDVAGALQPKQDEPGYELWFRELDGDDPDGASPGLSGSIDDAGVELTLAGVSLDAWKPEQIPEHFRQQIQGFDLEGEISSLTFKAPFVADPGGWLGLDVVANVDGVAMTLPIEQPVRLQNVTGKIKLKDQAINVDVMGEALDVPLGIEINYDLLPESVDLTDNSFTADITVKNHRIGSRPEFVAFLPDDVARWLGKFTAGRVADSAPDGVAMPAISPTGVISSKVTISRDAVLDASNPPPIRYEGWLELAEGRGAFEELPYPFESLEGRVSFSHNKGITIERIEGRAPTGARLQVTGEVHPLGEAAGVLLNIDVFDAPIDETLLASVSADRREMLERLFDRGAYKDLVARGLIQPSGSEAATAPVFDLGGSAELNLTLRRPEGIDTEWTRAISLWFDEAGVLPADFPLPILARGVRIDLDPQEATIHGGSYRPVNGFGGSLDGFVTLVPTARPLLNFKASGVPVDDLVLYAIAAPRSPDVGARTGREAAAEVVRGLDVHGTLGLTGTVLAREDSDDKIGFEVTVDLARSTFAPEPYTDRLPLLIDGTEGELRITEQRMDIEASGRGSAVSGDDTLSDPVDLGVKLTLDWHAAPGDLKVKGSVDVEDLELSLPIEQAVAAFAGGIGPLSDFVATNRRRLDPQGRVGARLVFDPEKPVTLEVGSLSGTSVDAFGGRLGLENATGSVVVEGGAGIGVTAEGLAGTLTFDSAPVGMLRFSGGARFDERIAEGRDALRVTMDRVRLESAFARGVIETFGGASFAEAFASIEPRGLVDAAVTVTSRGSRPEITTSLRPRSFGLTRHGTAVRFDDVTGRIVADSRGLRFESVEAANAGLRVACDGIVVIDGAGGAFVDLDLTGAAEAFNASVRACLPEAAVAALEAIAFRADGGLSLDGGRLSLRPAVDAAGRPAFATRFDGRLRVADAAADVGVAIDRIDAEATIELDQHPSEPGVGLALRVVGDRARALGVWLTDPKLRLTGVGEEPGLFLVPVFTADCAGGRISGHAAIRPAPGSSDQPLLAYETTVRVAQLRYETLRRQVEANRRGEPDPPEPVASDASSAVVNATTAVAGIVGDPATLRGRGAISADDGPLLRSSLLLPIIELLNFQLPSFGGSDDEVQVRFALDGTTARITEFFVNSSSIRLVGAGTLDLPSLEIDLRLLTRPNAPLPYFGRFFDAIRDELLTTRVVGPIGNPRTSGGLVPEATRAIGGVFGLDVGDGARALNELRRLDAQRMRSDSDRQRSRRRLLAPGGSPHPWNVEEGQESLIRY